MSFTDLRLRAGQGNPINERDHELMKKFTENPIDSGGMPEIFSEEMTCFTFESVIRPADNALVIHLKHLPKALRNPQFFNFATEYIRDRVGKFESLNASFIGEVDSANKLNSLDLMFTKYYPALMGDMEFIKSHTYKIGKSLDELLTIELGQYVSKT